MTDINQILTQVATENEYVWPAYWGGAVRSKTPPLIHAKVRELRREVGSLAAKKQAGGPMFPVRGAKELAQKLAQALNDLDLIAPVVAQEITLVPTADIPSNSTASGKPVFRTLAHVKATVRIGAADGSYVDMVGSGHGGDVDDKAGGKADTYGWKIALLKGLTIPDQDMVDTDDEAPSETVEKRTRATKAPAANPGGPAGSSTNPQVGDPGVAESVEGLQYVLKKIAEATDLATLTTIADNIKSGVLALAGADKLRASTAFVARKKALTDASTP